MSKLSPHVRFNDGKCREAMTLYKEIFGGKLQFMTVADSPMKGDMPAGAQNLIMHGSLENGDFVLFGSDMMRDKAVVGDNVSLFVECESEDQAKKYFSALSAGGEVFMPLAEQFWGGVFGVLTDKYGIEWSFNFQKKKMP